MPCLVARFTNTVMRSCSELDGNMAQGRGIHHYRKASNAMSCPPSANNKRLLFHHGPLRSDRISGRIQFCCFPCQISLRRLILIAKEEHLLFVLPGSSGERQKQTSDFLCTLQSGSLLRSVAKYSWFSQISALSC